MKTCILFLLGLTACYGRLNDYDQYPKDWRQYATALHYTILGNPTYNAIISHEAIQTGLSMMLIGASGKVANEIFEAMDLDSSLENIIQKVDAFNITSKPDRLHVGLYNRLYINPSAISEPLPRFKEEIHFANADLTSAPDPLEHFNNALYPIGDFKSDFNSTDVNSMFLINIAFIQGLFNDAGFDKNYTRQREFHSNTTHHHDVETLLAPKHWQQVATLPELRANMLSLSLANKTAKFVVLLPWNTNGLKRLEYELQHVDLRSLLNRTVAQYTTVYLPLIRISTNIDLSQNFSKMGVYGAFRSSQTDPVVLSGGFDKILSDGHDNGKLYVGEWKHSASIYLNESGLNLHKYYDIYRDSYMTIEPDYEPTFEPQFNADHPFFFAIVDQENIYFTGRYVS